MQRNALLAAALALGLPAVGLSQAPAPTPDPAATPTPAPTPRPKLVDLKAAPVTPEETARTLATYPTWKLASRDGSSLGPVREKRFWRAAGQVMAFELIPWAWNRYVMKEDFAYISMDTVRQNFETGFVYDRDQFSTNQSSHPYHGSIFFNSARSNGFTFWESIPFALGGSLVWEYFFENEPPSINDLVNTTLGGASRGEALFRLSRMLRDNTARGSSRFWRELGAGVLDPAGFLTRLLDGELGKVFPNPDDRLPASFILWGELGYRHNGGDATSSDQGTAGFRLRSGDPHGLELGRPFDYFDLDVEIAVPSGVLIPRSQVRGIVASRDSTRTAEVHHMLAAGMRFEYYNTGTSAFGGQGVDFLLLSRWALGKDLDVRTEAGAVGFLLAAVQTDYERLDVAATGRNYDYGPGGGVRLDARLRQREVDLVQLTYAAGWFNTSNGISENNRLQSLEVVGRVPITPRIGAGTGWSWSERFTTYDTLPSRTRSGSSWRLFGSWRFL